MRPGRLDREITVERLTTTKDSIGGEVETWTTQFITFAEYIPVSGAEALKFEQLTASRIARFIIRYTSDITTKDRISFDSNTWDIRFLKEIGRREWLEITAEAFN